MAHVPSTKAGYMFAFMLCSYAPLSILVKYYLKRLNADRKLAFCEYFWQLNRRYWHGNTCN